MAPGRGVFEQGGASSIGAFLDSITGCHSWEWLYVVHSGIEPIGSTSSSDCYSAHGGPKSRACGSNHNNRRRGSIQGSCLPSEGRQRHCASSSYFALYRSESVRLLSPGVDPAFRRLCPRA